MKTKIKIAVIAMMGMSLGIKAQDNKIETTGNVGIGTTNPKSKFQISASENDRILISNSEVNYNKSSPKLSFFGYTYGPQVTGPSIQKIHTASYGRGRLAFFQHGRADYTSEEEVMSILPDGNIGIGTTNPSAKLQIVDEGTSSVTSLQLNNRIKFRGDGVLTWGSSAQYGILSWDSDKTIIGAQTSKKLSLYANGSEKMIISTNGNAALYGKFEAKEIKVTTSPTADFVFEDEYNLPTLKSIEKHIKEKKHLPEIASAKQMEKNGVNIGNFQIQLLQKIEELTLYTISQEKEIKTLKKQNSKIDKQQKEIEELKSLVQKLLKDKN